MAVIALSAWAVAATLPAFTASARWAMTCVERLALVGGIALDRLDQVGDEVGAAAQLDGDAAERLVDQRPKPDQPVVDGDA